MVYLKVTYPFSKMDISMYLYPRQTVVVACVCVCVCVSGAEGEGDYSVFISVCPSVTFWCLLFILLNNLKDLFIFCINVDVNKILL